MAGKSLNIRQLTYNGQTVAELQMQVWRGQQIHAGTVDASGIQRITFAQMQTA